MQFIKQPYNPEELIEILHPFVKEWFFNTYKSFSLPQLYGVMEVHLKNNILISAPTGGTKTLTSFLSIINELVNLADKGELKDQVYAVYLSPLKALSNDISVNLERPLAAITEIAKKHGKKLDIRVGLRTGDTTASEKQKMLRKSPHILVTTPESLALMLSSYKFVDLLKDVNWCIIDEIHSLAENKRGVHMSISLERLQHISPYMARIGLSATVAPIEEIAKFLVGDRDCKIANVELIKKFDLNRNIKFETYATYRIRGAIIDGVRKQDWLSRSQRLRIKNNYENQFEDPSARNYFSDWENDKFVMLSIDDPDFYEKKIADSSISDDSIDGLYMAATADFAEKVQNKLFLKKAIGKLTAQERKVIFLYYFKGKNFKEIGQLMHITESRVSQINKKILLTLKKELNCPAAVSA